MPTVNCLSIEDVVKAFNNFCDQKISSNIEVWIDCVDVWVGVCSNVKCLFCTVSQPVCDNWELVRMIVENVHSILRRPTAGRHVQITS